MTESTLKEIVRRAVSDAAFRGQLRSDPAKALAGIGLTAQERSALTAGDPTQLTALGVDQRMSKAYSAGLFSEASKVVAGDPDLVNSATISDESTGAGTRAIVGDPAAAAAAFESNTTWPQAHLRMVEQDLDTGATAQASAADTTSVPTHLQMLEQDLDTGIAPAVDDSSGLAPAPSDAQITEF